MRDVVRMKDGGFQLDLSYFKPLGSNEGMQIAPDGTVRLARHFSDRMITSLAIHAHHIPKSPSATWILAYAMQHRFEEVFFHLLHQLHKRMPQEDVAMAGGCALNSVANGKTFYANTVSEHMDSTRRRR